MDQKTKPNNGRGKQISREYDIVIKELPDSLVLENLAFTLKEQLDIFIVCSSVGLYGSVCGANIFTTSRRYRDKYPRLQVHLEECGYIYSQYTQI